MKIMGLVALSIPCQTPNISNSQIPKMNRFGACSQTDEVQAGRGRGIGCFSV